MQTPFLFAPLTYGATAGAAAAIGATLAKITIGTVVGATVALTYRQMNQ